ncbi:MerR family transcriptional regulator (plasmid) [Sinorhizobium meliloti]
MHVETIRYYERVGMLPKPLRQPNGRRIYGKDDAMRLRFIRHARDLGFDLASVRTLLGLQEQPEASCAEATRLAREQLDKVEDRIARLTALRVGLSRMIASCDQGVVASCKVIDALSSPDL